MTEGEQTMTAWTSEELDGIRGTRRRVATTQNAILVEDAASTRMIGMPAIQAVPAREAPTNGPVPSATDAGAGPPVHAHDGKPYGAIPAFNGPFVD
jgi:hypothetical protein